MKRPHSVHPHPPSCTPPASVSLPIAPPAPIIGLHIVRRLLLLLLLLQRGRLLLLLSHKSASVPRIIYVEHCTCSTFPLPISLPLMSCLLHLSATLLVSPVIPLAKQFCPPLLVCLLPFFQRRFSAFPGRGGRCRFCFLFCFELCAVRFSLHDSERFGWLFYSVGSFGKRRRNSRGTSIISARRWAGQICWIGTAICTRLLVLVLVQRCSGVFNQLRKPGHMLRTVAIRSFIESYRFITTFHKFNRVLDAGSVRYSVH